MSCGASSVDGAMPQSAMPNACEVSSPSWFQSNCGCRYVVEVDDEGCSVRLRSESLRAMIATRGSEQWVTRLYTKAALLIKQGKEHEGELLLKRVLEIDPRHTRECSRWAKLAG